MSIKATLSATVLVAALHAHPLTAQSGSNEAARQETARHETAAEMLRAVDARLALAPADPDLLQSRFFLLLALGQRENAADAGHVAAAHIPAGTLQESLRVLARSLLTGAATAPPPTPTTPAPTHAELAALSDAELHAKFFEFRRHGQLAGMHMCVQHLDTRNAQSPDAHYIRAEFFGVDSPHFDKRRAIQEFAAFNLALTKLGDPESALAPLCTELEILSDKPTSELRKLVFGYILALESDERLQLAVGASPAAGGEPAGRSGSGSALGQLLASLDASRATRSYDAFRDTLEVLLAEHPDDPLVWFAEGEFYGSAGASFDPKRAAAAFEKFVLAAERAEQDGATVRHFDGGDRPGRLPDLARSHAEQLHKNQALPTLASDTWIKTRIRKAESRAQQLDYRIERRLPILERNERKLAHERNRRTANPAALRAAEKAIAEDQEFIAKQAAERSELEAEVELLRSLLDG